MEAIIRERFGASAFARWMGMMLVAAGEGSSEIHLAIQPHHLNPGGIVHGGVIATLLDACIGVALRTRLAPGSDHVTIDLDVRYLGPVRSGTLVGRGRALKVGRRVSFGEAELTDASGAVVARGAAAFLVVSRR
jgi:uncharacterized protein (TIGR00369 family)